jgi:hypothetical protein
MPLPVQCTQARLKQVSSVAVADGKQQVPIDWLHLDPQIQRLLARFDIKTLAALEDNLENPSGQLAALSHDTLRQVEVALACLHQATNEAGQIDWLAYWQGCGVKILPSDHRAGRSPRQILSRMPELIASILLQEIDERTAVIIQRRYGLAGPKLTLDELGKAYGLTRERVRQLETRGLERLRQMLLLGQPTNKRHRIHPEIQQVLHTLWELLPANPGQAILEGELLSQVGQRFELVSKTLEPALLLLFEIAGIKRLDINYGELLPIRGILDATQRAHIREGVKRLHLLLTTETAAALPVFDVVVRINKGKRKGEALTLTQVNYLVDLCSSVERTADGTVRGKFEHLQGRGNQVERLLTEVGRSMTLPEILRELNHRLARAGQPKVKQRNLGNQISTDGRFVPIGRSGLWGLKAWPNLESRSISELIEQFLTERNQPSTVSEIYSYIQQRRPVKRSSVEIYLAETKRFRKVDRTHWGLATWVDARNLQNWDVGHVATFVAGVFKQHKAKKLDFKVVKQALMEAAGVTPKQAQGMLVACPAIQTVRGAKWNDRYAEFQPDYRQQLAQPREKTRKKRTLRQKVNEAVRKMLEEAPAHELPLAEVVARLHRKYNHPEKTFYQYIAGLEFVERIDVPGSRAKLCRLKGTRQDLSFPQIRDIGNETLKSKVERVIPYLNLEDIDLGLFLLSKEFEATVKAFVVRAADKGRLDTGKNNPANMNLYNMVTCVANSGFIANRGELQYLREERNSRAHGTMPSLHERRVLMENVQYLAGMYISYIKHFDDLMRDLE